MIASLLSLIGRSCLAPRAVYRELSAAGPGPVEIGLVGLLGFILQTIVARAMTLGFPEVPLRANLVAEAIVFAAVFLVAVMLVFRIGRMMGGTGSLGDVALAVGWFSVLLAFPLVLTTYLELMFLSNIGEIVSDRRMTPDELEARLQQLDPATQGIIARGVIGFVVLLCYTIWVFASLMTEAHGFRGVGGPIIGTVGLALVLFYLMAAMQPALG